MTYNIILASGSPRRQQLLKEMGYDFQITKTETDESFPSNLKKEQIVLYLSQKKAKAINSESLLDNDLIITADTIVWCNKEVMNKPANDQEAYIMLKKLSGKKHVVYTGVCLKSKTKTKYFYDKSKVYFKRLTDDEITYYVNNYTPYDKAGAYGIQEWIGYIGIEKIKGSYYNIMGLPTAKLYRELIKF